MVWSGRKAREVMNGSDFSMIVESLISSEPVSMYYIPLTHHIIVGGERESGGRFYLKEILNSELKTYFYQWIMPLGFYYSDSAHLWAATMGGAGKQSFACTRIVEVISFQPGGEPEPESEDIEGPVPGIGE